MKFSIAINMERTEPDETMTSVTEHALDKLRLAEQGGFDIAWAAEHHGIELTIGPNPFTMLTHWAAHTRSIRLGTAVVVAPYWHPLRVASEAALVDVYSDGRLELGLGRGAFQYEFDRMANAMVQTEGASYLREMVPVVKKLWRGDYRHDGQHWQFPSATSVPKPVEGRQPPIWISARSPESFDFAVRERTDILTAPLFKPFSEVENLADKLQTACQANDATYRPRWSVLRQSVVYEDPSEWPAIAEFALSHGRRFEGLFSTQGKVVNGFPQALQIADGRTGRLSLENIGEGTLHGTPQEVIRQLEAYRNLGVDYFMYNSDFGLPKSTSLRSLELFCEHVVPHFCP